MFARRPEYVRLKQRSRWLAWLWQGGRAGTFVGLMGVVMIPVTLVACIVIGGYGAQRPLTPVRLWIALVSFVGFAGLTIGSVCLKSYAQKRAGLTTDGGDGHG